MWGNFRDLISYYIVYVIVLVEIIMIVEFLLKRKFTVHRTVLYILGCGLLSVALRIVFKEAWKRYDMILYFLVVGMLYKGNRTYKFFSIINAIVFIMFTEDLVILFGNGINSRVLGQLISALIVFSIAPGIRIIFKDIQVTRNDQGTKGELGILIITNLITIVGYGMADLMYKKPSYMIHNKFMYGIFVVIILIINMGIIVVINRGRYNRYYSEVNKIIEKQLIYYQNIELKNREIRSIKHDMLNHLLCIGNLIKDGEQEQGLEYVQNICNQITTNMMIIQTGNTIVDTIINEKAAIAKKNDIHIEINIIVPKVIEMDMVDICILLSNSLDNAIEACLKISDISGRKIAIELSAKQGYFNLRVTNSVIDNIIIRGNTIKTNKADKSDHGYGIENMKRVVRKYNGDITLHCENNMFVLQALLKIGN